MRVTNKNASEILSEGQEVSCTYQQQIETVKITGIRKCKKSESGLIVIIEIVKGTYKGSIFMFEDFSQIIVETELKQYGKKMQTKEQIQTKIQNLENKDKVSRLRRDEIKAKYSRPAQWMADEDYNPIRWARIVIYNELAELRSQLNEIEDQEWADQQATHYPDGQV